MVIGLIIGEVSAGALYVFAICGGFFLYISLSDMVSAKFSGSLAPVISVYPFDPTKF
ncbi:unnamed protein product [Hymenolepis diminuta]|uniref:Uncharacterized protein n=1 Tax=Hymenolepis diminuta TaxID=6216 RepID=A0A3P6ZRY3_HYMDI|nr:unnamed protein product [Hymenolepis diminuta]